MAQQTINIGTAANDGTGDPLRSAFTKSNANFTELYAGVGGGGSGTDASTLTAANSGAGTVNTLTFNATVESAVYDVTLTANWAPTLAGVVASKYRRIVVYIRGGAGGFTFTMPTATPGAGTIIWSGGAGAPSINTAAGAVNRIWFETTNGGTTVLAGY